MAPGWLTPARGGVALAGIVLSRSSTAPAGSARAWISGAWPIRGEAAMQRFWLDDFFARSTASAPRFSRIVGWIDRYIVDGILNVLSAWTLTAGDRLRRIQTGQAQDYVYGIALGVLLLMVWMRWPRERVGLPVPVLSIITWSPFVGALLIMFLARHRPLLVRWLALIGAARAARAVDRALRGLRPRRGGLPVRRGHAAGAVARHQLPAWRSTA